MKRNHIVICSHLLAVGNEILSYVGSFNISAHDDGVKTTRNTRRAVANSKKTTVQM